MARPALRLRSRLHAFLLAGACAGAPAAFSTSPASAAPVPDGGDGLDARQLAIVINDDDPDSVAIGDYYRRRRAIPDANVVHVRIPGRPHALTPERFRQLKDEIDSRLGPQVQAVLMVWTAPWKVGCHGITGAYTLGLDPALCADTCAAGRPSPYFNAPGPGPLARYGMRLSMLLPIASQDAARDLVDRGIASGIRRMASHAWYLTTSEGPRNARAVFFPAPGHRGAHGLTVHRLHADALVDAAGVLVYQTGKAQVDRLDSVQFVPGALADHLTSHGGELLSSGQMGGQMSSLRWLEAGATASYGTVGEPCNHWQKFPNPAVLLRHYLRGETAIEAYWKSVAWPGQGVFIGEPLAAPYRQTRTRVR